MFRTSHSLVWITWVGITFAQTDAGFPKERQDREDQSWAEKSGLTVAEIRGMRIAAGVSGRVSEIDANALKRNKHILLVEGSQCVRLHVFERMPTGLKEVWSTTEVPSRNWSVRDGGMRPGQWICSQSPRPANVRCTPDGRIVVEVPVLLDPSQRNLPMYTYTYAWDGKRYALLDGDH